MGRNGHGCHPVCNGVEPHRVCRKRLLEGTWFAPSALSSAFTGLPMLAAGPHTSAGLSRRHGNSPPNPSDLKNRLSNAETMRSRVLMSTFDTGKLHSVGSKEE